MVSIKAFAFNPFQVNTFVLFDESKECLIIDASCYRDEEFQELFAFISSYNLKPVAILNTHGHVDHLLGTKKVCEKYSIGLMMHQDDEFLLQQVVDYGRTFGFKVESPGQPEQWLKNDMLFQFGNSEIKVWNTPGHSPGSVVFYCKEAGFIITGDVLFAGSIGRTDLPGGDFNQLIESIKQIIMVLPRGTVVYPGHGDKTSIGEEMDHNPFLNRSF